MSFEELMQAFCDHLRSLRRSPSTVANYSATARDFTRHCRETGYQTPHEVPENSLGTYVEDLEQRQFSRLSIYSRHRMIRTWFSWAHLRGHLLLDRLREVHYKHPPCGPRRVPSEQQVADFIDMPTPHICARRDRCLVDFLYGTGLRIGECLGLDLADLDLERCQVTVRNSKTKKTRVVPFGESVQRLMLDYLENVRPRFCAKSGHDQALWLTKRCCRHTPLGAEEMMRNRSKQMGYSITPHSLRHAYATHMLLRGASLVSLSALLGHVYIGSTQRYTHLVPTDLKQEMLATHPRGVRKKRKGKKKR